MLLEAIRRFPFDTVLLALNAADRHHLLVREKLLPLAVEKEMGIIGMKIPARGLLLGGWTPPPTRRRATGHPSRHARMREAMRYVLSLPVSTVIVGCDSHRAARGERPDRPRVHATLGGADDGAGGKAEPVHRQALFFRRWEG